MPSHQLTTATAGTPAYGFLPAFFTTEPPGAPADEAPRTPANAPCTSYEARRDGSHLAFCGSPRFAQYRKEVRQNVDFIAIRCKQLKMDDAALVAIRFHQFYQRRFEQAYFEAHAELLDGAAKRSFDAICAMLADPRIRPEAQAAAIRNLSLGIGVCSPGVAANIIEVEGDLSLAVGGLRSRLWQAKVRLARALLQELVSEKYGAEANFSGNQAHYVNGAWDYVADAVGLTRVGDPLAPWMGSEFLAPCRAQVLAALTPDRIASTIAQDLLSQFRGAVLDDATSAAGECTGARLASFAAVVKGIRQDVGLGEEQLRLHAFVRLDAGGERYEVLDDPSLVALELLKAIDAEGLLAGVPVPLGDPVERDGRYMERYRYGSLVSWRLWHASAPDGAPSWTDHDDVEVIDVTDLRDWPDLDRSGLDWPGLDRRGLDGPCVDGPGEAAGSADAGPGAAARDVVLPPAAAVRRLLASDDPADLMRVRARWLGTAEEILKLLRRMEPGQADQYLRRNMEYLREDLPRGERDRFASAAVLAWEQGRVLASAWYSEMGMIARLPYDQAVQALRERMDRLIEAPVNERRRWMDAIMHLGDPAKALARAWYPDPWTLLSEKNPAKSGTRLQQWLAADNAAALDAVRELMTEAWSMNADPSWLGDAISRSFRDYQGTHVLKCLAQAPGTAAAGALHRLLRHLLTMPALRELVVPRLPALFHDPGAYRSDLMEMVLKRDAPAIEALHRMLTDDLILPGIRDCMLTILAGAYPGSDKPMWHALRHGKAAVIKAYGALLADVVAAIPEIAAQLPELLMPNVGATSNRSDRLGLLQASRIGAVDAIRAYGVLLTHPSIFPHIAQAIPQLILDGPRIGPWSPARRETLGLLFEPRLPGHAACLDLAAHPLILPRVLEALPRDATAIRARLRQRHAAAIAAEATEAGAGQAAHRAQAADARPRQAGPVRYWMDRLFQRF
ncbi:DUF4132 domain-containing protein [Bordetella sputigena]|uniref:hypothetical protein n=1 Tax=Bordetella sputigena TaxID=1416810 RepID=UPI0039EF2800